MKKDKKCAYVFVVGGVMSGVGKGITTASIGLLLKSSGLSVTLMKADPYLNVDAGTMNPTEHGEVFVMKNGLETDQDIGNYERFLSQELSPVNYMTNGMIFWHVIKKERALEYKGKCVEPTYHISEEIINRIYQARDEASADVVVMEIGGTIGEYQNAIFLEAIRMLRAKHGSDSVKVVMVSYVPIPKTIGEAKTKPTQNAVRQLNGYGVTADFIVARSTFALDEKRKEKLSLMCGIPTSHIISAPDVESIYDIPLNFEKDGFAKSLLDSLRFDHKKSNLNEWKKFVTKTKTAKQEVNIGIVGKYFATGDFSLSDAYVSVIESLKHAAAFENKKVNLTWLDATDFEAKDKNSQLKKLSKFDGILVPGGFGSRGTEGLINVINYCRTNKVPYFGICYGMQLMMIEYARSVMKLKDAHTLEVDPKTQHPVVMILPDQLQKLKDKDYGGSMRLGTYDCLVSKNTHAFDAYKKVAISERHRHRYEVNPQYIDQFKKAGMVISGTSPSSELVEIAELPKKVHPYFVGCQFHPEFLSRPLSPHPLFLSFIKTAGKK